MLKRIKNSITPMLDTLGEALSQYFALEGLEADKFFADIKEFIDKLNESLEEELPSAKYLSERINGALKSRDFSMTEDYYNEYCNAVEAIPVQYKVVFFPYYDNTWDSLASVYEAFAADPLFVTEIVIIPIVRNTPTGNKFVYEDYLTEKGIPNTSYQTYDVSVDKPDFVFYNNPYDGVNIEKFQSHYLKQHAGCLVYIPYYLYIHTFISDKEHLLNEVKTVTELPGHDSADVFIVQGTSFLRKFSHRSRNGKKMIALGNPKIDHMLKIMESPLRYHEWESIIDGKTVFFLNTHYTMVTRNLGKIWAPYLFKYIEEHQDLALIWRPHPQSFLMTSENPQTDGELAWLSYLKIAEENERIMLDTTASAASAMMYSNAVISQYSSMLSEAVFVDNPIFYAGYEIKEIELLIKFGRVRDAQYFEKLKRLREYNSKNLFYTNAMHYFEPGATPESLEKFIKDVQNGIDDKKDLRKLYREQLLANLDGTCGEKIHEYIVNLIKRQLQKGM